jgi:5,10-methylene-tetrahydrofolate dehydrogenase/methenyl tetrahydrofolate cyclohydrolase
MTDLQMSLNPVDVDAKIRKQTVKSMAADLASGKSITQIAIDFNMPFSTAQKMLRDYIPTQKDIDDFRMKFAIKKLRKNKYRGL